MAEYKASSPNCELIGSMVASLWAAFPENFQGAIKGVLLKHGVADIQPEKWYLLQSVLDALKELETTFGHHLLSQVGEQAALRAPVPPEVKSFKDCLINMNATLKKINRGGSAGGYEVQEDDAPGGLQRFRVIASTPFPCSLTRGYLESFARRFGPVGTQEVLVRHDEQNPCRRNGADTCTYYVTML
jgi:hypothetical protein